MDDAAVGTGMSDASTFLFGRAAWTIGSYGASLALRLGSNVVMTWFLAPEIIGEMVVVNSVRLGVELLTDVGIEQNIVHNRDGTKIAFVNTAWTLQIIRGALLSLLFAALSEPLSGFFGIERGVFLLMSLAPLVNSLCSTRIFLLVRGLDVRTRNLLELASEAIAFCVSTVLVASYPTIWSLVAAALCALGIRAALSYLIPGPGHRPMLVGRYVGEIVSFGKWIVVSSLVIYASTNVDRLFLAKSIPFTLLGIYGLARTIADLPPTLANRVSYQVVFPALAAARGEGGSGKVDALDRARLVFVMLAALGLGTGIAWADVAIRILYDARYHDAGWMLCVLLAAAWFAVLSNLNEATLLGFGRPAYNSLSNGVRLAALAIGLPLGLAQGGLLGAVAVIVASEACRYLSVLYGQSRVGLTHLRQDGLSTAAVALAVLAWSGLRAFLGLGFAWTGAA